MLQHLLDYIREQHLIADGDRVLLAVSGGRDSVCLAHLMHRAGIPFAIAHCNFNLRPVECDRDQHFVRQLADQYHVPFHTVSFDTRSYATSNHLSIEEAARQLRYNWFASILAEQPAGQHWLLATAHHRDDSIETFFLNLFRGTGISGLHGILPLSEFTIHNSQFIIIRPLLCFSRADIDHYVEENQLDYVEDSTNALLDARRNQLRHRLIPLLRELYHSFDNTMQDDIQHMRDTELIYRVYLDTLRAETIQPLPSRIPGLKQEAITLEALRQLNPQRTLLFELLRSYGFNAATVDSILASLPNPRTGSHFLSTSHEAVIDRTHLVIAPLHQNIPDCKLQITTTDTLPNIISTLNSQLSTSTVLVDADLVKQPLTLRQPRTGDRFHPFGMQQSRLLSDFFKDIKLNRIEKRHLQILVDADDRIVWIVGLRSDNRFRISENTRRILEISVR